MPMVLVARTHDVMSDRSIRSDNYYTVPIRKWFAQCPVGEVLARVHVGQQRLVVSATGGADGGKVGAAPTRTHVVQMAERHAATEFIGVRVPGIGGVPRRC